MRRGSKYSPAKRKSMKDVLGEVKIRATRMAANTEIYVLGARACTSAPLVCGLQTSRLPRCA